MHTQFLLKDAIRWIYRGGNLVLQVLRTENHGEKEIWEDVPIVFDEEQKFCQCKGSITKDRIHCSYCGFPYKPQKG